MPFDALLPKAGRRRIAIGLGLFLFAVYLFTYRGGFHSVDEVSMFAVTESLVKFGRVNTDQIAWTQWTTSQAEAQGFFGPDGHVYSKKGLALSLAQVPLYWLALWLPGLGMLQTVSLLNAIVTAATSLLIFMFASRLGFSTLIALAVALIFGLATIASIYAKYLFSEPLAGLFLLAAAYMLLAYRQEGGWRHIFIAGLSAGLAVLTRANNLFLLPVFGFYLLWVEYKRSVSALHNSQFTIRPFLPALITFALALAIPGATMLIYNAARSGDPLQTGYDLTLFTPNILLGLYKLLFSPLRGLFVYSPVLLLSLPGWWYLRRTHPAEAWLFAGLVGVTLALFSAWSSGEGLSWGSRFLVPVAPFFALSLAPIIKQVAGHRAAGEQGGRRAEEQTTQNTKYAIRNTHRAPRATHHPSSIPFFALLFASFLIQLLGVAINPWVYLSRLQADFGGEFFLEKTEALYNFRYSQIAGQLQHWSVANSDLIWWQPWGFDLPAFGLGLALALLTGWGLWVQVSGCKSETYATRNAQHTPRLSPFASPLTLLLTIAVTCFLLTRYYHTDRQFGPPNDAYTQALTTIARQSRPNESIITVAQYHYHVPMNRFKARLPLVGFAQQTPPLPNTAKPLLASAAGGQNIWLVTIGFAPAAPDNAAEQWLALNTFKVSDVWLPDEVRLARYTAAQPTDTRPAGVALDNELALAQVRLRDSLRPGQLLPVELTWQTLAQPQAGYVTFLQLLDMNGRLVAQHDSPPNGGYSPTSAWQPGQTITSRHALALPDMLPAGDYRLIAGLYNPATGQRLAQDSGADFVDLGNITIIESVAQKPKNPAPK